MSANSQIRTYQLVALLELLNPFSLSQPNHAILVRLFRTSENQWDIRRARVACSNRITP